MSKFTPGKWEARQSGTKFMPLWRVGIPDASLKSGFRSVAIGMMSDADARLIAAAPELYEMLREELIPISDYGGLLSFSREAKVHALLARIDGEGEE